MTASTRRVKMIDVPSYDDLISRLKDLDPSEPDSRLCFRGQVRDYPLVSSMARHVNAPDFSLRETVDNRSLWSLAATVLAEQHLPSSLPVETPAVLAAARTAMVEGLLQHYGFRTHFVDVTVNPDVALCFAHFQYLDMYPVFDGDPNRPKVRRVAWYEPSAESHGYFYVLDCVKWHPRHGRPLHGQVLDLTTLVRPGWNRVQMQQAMVVHSDPRKRNLGDLSSRIRAVYRIPLPLPGADLAPRETAMLFPTPKDDPIYRTLLESRFVEFIYVADHPVRPWRRAATDSDSFYFQTEIPPLTELTLWQRGIDLPEYHVHPESSRDISLFRSCDRLLKPTLYFPWLKERIESVKIRGGNRNSTSPARPSRTILRRVTAGDMVLVHAPFDQLRAVSGEVDARSALSRPRLSMFFEFSPFTFVGTYSGSAAIRGVWIGRNGKQLMVTVFGAASRGPWVGELGIFERTGGRYRLVNRPKHDMQGYFELALKLLVDFVEQRAEVRPLAGSRYKQMRYPR